MKVDELVGHHPALFHMATAGSWDRIREHGLWTTESVVRSAGLSAADESALLSRIRPHSVPIEHPKLGRVVIRDQGPLKYSFLEASLDGLTVEQWLGMLNDRVFFWLHPGKLAELLAARRYRELEQDVLTLDTARLVEAHADRVRLSPINSGATIYPNPRTRRTATTFATIDAYPYEERRRARGRRDAIVELAVIGGIPDIKDFIVEGRRMRGAQVLRPLT